jgi:hypothetical protein
MIGIMMSVVESDDALEVATQTKKLEFRRWK